MTQVSFPITGDDDADAFLLDDPLALLIGMLLDQQVPMERAFGSPHVLSERLGDRWGAHGIAGMDPDDLVAVFAEKPALHRFPSSMAKRVHALCDILVDRFDGDAARLWEGRTSAKELYDDLRALPGFGEEKSRIFVALLAKRLGHEPEGWREVAGPFGDDEPRSAADVSSPEALTAVREWKKRQKAAGRSKADPPAG